jgi:hypothetical protein
MGDESGGKEMLEMVDRYSVLHGPAMRQTNSFSTFPNSGIGNKLL